MPDEKQRQHPHHEPVGVEEAAALLRLEADRLHDKATGLYEKKQSRRANALQSKVNGLRDAADFLSQPQQVSRVYTIYVCPECGKHLARPTESCVDGHKNVHAVPLNVAAVGQQVSSSDGVGEQLRAEIAALRQVEKGAEDSEQGRIQRFAEELAKRLEGLLPEADPDALKTMRPSSSAHLALVAAVLRCLEADVYPDTIRRFVEEELAAALTQQQSTSLRVDIAEESVAESDPWFEGDLDFDQETEP